MQTHDEELLSAFLDRELDSNELTRVKELLASSNECREELERFRTVKEWTGSAPAVGMPQDLLNSLKAQVANHVPEKKHVWELPRFRMWTLTAAAASVTLMVGIWTFQQLPSQNQYLELDALMAVHNAGQSDLSTHHGIVAASTYSSQLQGNQDDVL